MVDTLSVRVGNNNPLKVFKLKTCRKCKSKDIHYTETDRIYSDRLPKIIFYVGCASCGYCHTSECLDDDSDRSIHKNRLIAKWNADRDYKDKRVKRNNIKKEKK